MSAALVSLGVLVGYIAGWMTAALLAAADRNDDIHPYSGNPNALDDAILRHPAGRAAPPRTEVITSVPTQAMHITPTRLVCAPGKPCTRHAVALCRDARCCPTCETP